MNQLEYFVMCKDDVALATYLVLSERYENIYKVSDNRLLIQGHQVLVTVPANKLSPPVISKELLTIKRYLQDKIGVFIGALDLLTPYAQMELIGELMELL